jgi:hypothetical protein
VCSNQKLAGDVESLIPSKPVHVIEDCVDFRWGKDIHVKVRDTKIKNALWFGYSNTQYLLEEFLPVIESWGITLYVISDKPFLAPNVIHIPFSEERVWELALEVDVAILPDYSLDPHNPRLPYKTKSKTYQCQWWGLPVVSFVEDLQRLDSPEERKMEALKGVLVAQDRHPLEAVKAWRRVLQL